LRRSPKEKDPRCHDTGLFAWEGGSIYLISEEEVLSSIDCIINPPD
jgi:hypothetical protein